MDEYRSGPNRAEAQETEGRGGLIKEAIGLELDFGREWWMRS